jgi:hypothetical protein
MCSSSLLFKGQQISSDLLDYDTIKGRRVTYDFKIIV